MGFTEPPAALLLVPNVGALLLFMTSAILTGVPLNALLLLPFIGAAAVVVISEAVLQDDCSNAGAYAGSISKIAASVVWEAYVFIFVSLMFVAYLTIALLANVEEARVRRFKERLRRDNWCWAWRSRHYLTSKLMQWGVVFVILGAIVPNRAHNCALGHTCTKVGDCDVENQSPWSFPSCGSDADTSYLYVFHNVHVFGLMAGGLLSMVGANIRAFRALRDEWNHECGSHNRTRCFMTALIVGVSSCVSIVFIIMFNSVDHWRVEPPLIHICRNYNTREGCLGHTVPSLWFNQSVILRGKWPCEWDASADYLQLPCTDPECKLDGRLYELQYAVVVEFNAICFWLVALSSCIMLMQKVEIWNVYFDEESEGFEKEQSLGLVEVGR